MSKVPLLGRRATIASLTLLGGCNTVLQRPKYVARTTWPLLMTPPASLRAKAGGKPRKVLMVQDIEPSAGLDQRGVQWLDENGSVHVDYYNVWDTPPAEAVSDDVRRWLSASGLFAAVVGSGSSLTADLLLEGELDALTANPQSLSARAALAITLLNPRVVPAKPLLQKTLTGAAAMPEASPEGVVKGERGAVENVLNELVTTLRPYA